MNLAKKEEEELSKGANRVSCKLFHIDMPTGGKRNFRHFNESSTPALIYYFIIVYGKWLENLRFTTYEFSFCSCELQTLFGTWKNFENLCNCDQENCIRFLLFLIYEVKVRENIYNFLEHSWKGLKSISKVKKEFLMRKNKFCSFCSS